ncbi:DUF6655 family protein [Candidatus Nitrosacidococcus tergens]|uniref:Uncharacterized protein n=1 Tax=Candidatus Nitrosacidococcus tergens TaxID=553981 RepID=A0A7G1Q8G6_9GAMM|nr:DUF6655 family protein [Candidatus Nitrosacidococcus tergens]CAB1275231.1 conserved protein of unknown function [Candidatus Nitrosacidococcus tergens]
MFSGCTTTVNETLPSRTATEELLISTAVDHSVVDLNFNIPERAKIWLDTNALPIYKDSGKNQDILYAISAIKAQLLKQGGRLAKDEKEADLIMEARVGALSIDKIERLIGIPSFSVPVPLSGTFKTPEIAFFKKENMRGIAKLAFFIYDAKTGELRNFSVPIYGDSYYIHVHTPIHNWFKNDLIPTVHEMESSKN